VNLAGVDELLDAGDVLDGDVWIHAVLVERIHRVGPQPTQRVDGRLTLEGARQLSPLIRGEGRGSRASGLARTLVLF
jgi:hypothetical protein